MSVGGQRRHLHRPCPLHDPEVTDVRLCIGLPLKDNVLAVRRHTGIKHELAGELANSVSVPEAKRYWRILMIDSVDETRTIGQP